MSTHTEGRPLENRIVKQRLLHSLQMVPEAAGFMSGFGFQLREAERPANHFVEATVDQIRAATQQLKESLDLIVAAQR